MSRQKKTQFGYAHEGRSPHDPLEMKVGAINEMLDAGDTLLTDVHNRVALDSLRVTPAGPPGYRRMVIFGLEDLGDTVPEMVAVYDELRGLGLEIRSVEMAAGDLSRFVGNMRPLVGTDTRELKFVGRRGRPAAITGNMLLVANRILESGLRGVKACDKIIEEAGEDLGRSSFYEFQRRWLANRSVKE